MKTQCVGIKAHRVGNVLNKSQHTADCQAKCMRQTSQADYYTMCTLRGEDMEEILRIRWLDP